MRRSGFTGALHGTLRDGVLNQGALNDGFAGSAFGRRLTQLFDGRADITPQKRPIKIARTRELDVAHVLAIAFEYAIRIGKGRASRKPEIDVPRVGRDVAEHVLHLFAEAEPDCDGVGPIDGFGGVGNFFEDNFAEGEREVEYGAVVSFEESDELRIGRTLHNRREYTA